MKKGRRQIKKTLKSKKIDGGERDIPPSVASTTDRSSVVEIIENQKATVSPSSSSASAATSGGALKKVELQPKKTKVILAKNESRKTHINPVKTRKIHLAIHGIHKNIHKAKTIKKKSVEIPLDQLKKELKQHGMWKEGSKAPESMLRSIYADFKTLQEKAL